MSPAASAAPTRVVVGGGNWNVDGNSSLTNVFASIRTKKQHLPSALRKSRDTGTMGAFTMVVPPFEGAFPSMLNSQLLCGLPVGLNPGVEYAPLKLGIESIPRIPGSVAC